MSSAEGLITLRVLDKELRMCSEMKLARRKDFVIMLKKRSNSCRLPVTIVVEARFSVLGSAFCFDPPLTSVSETILSSLNPAYLISFSCVPFLRSLSGRYHFRSRNIFETISPHESRRTFSLGGVLGVGWPRRLEHHTVFFKDGGWRQVWI